MLQISLLGPFAVSQDDKPVISFKTDHSRAILAYTAAYRGVPQRRDAIAALLWPDDPNDKALKKFRVELNRLRPVIGDADATPPHYFINRKELEFNPDSEATIDVVLFESLLEEVRLHGHRTLSGCPSCVSKLEQAAELYRGEFMAGFNLNSDLWQGWLTKQREGFKVQALELFGMLNAVQQERGEWEAVLELGQKQIDLDPWNEDGYQALMRAAYALGDRAGAMGWYEACEKVLYEELGVDPSAETLALQQDILDDELELETNAAADIPNNLPDQLPPFFGREDQITDLVRLLADPQNRLLNLVGIGGIGKTRLSLEVGQRVKESFPDGVWFVPLADIRPDTVDPLLNAVADAIRLERDGKNWIGDQILDFMRDKRALIILDNLEHIIDFVIEPISGFVEQTAQTAILATSREPINLSSETIVNLGGLGEQGIRLFEERAQKVDQKFEITLENRPEIDEICKMVGGSPLAISLAAAWVRRRSPRQIIEAINKSMDFLTSRMRDTDARHRSIRAVFDSSWELLESEDQGVYAALSVFKGSFTAEAVEEIIGASIFDLDILCEKSLVEQAPDSTFVLHPILRQYVSEIQFARDDTFQLHPTMRGFAQEKLNGNQLQGVQEKHSHYFLDRLASFDTKIFGLEPQIAVGEIQFDYENILEAWSYAVSHQTFERLGRGIDPLAEFFITTGRFVDGEHLFGQTLDAAEEAHLRGMLLTRRGRLQLLLNQMDQATQSAQDALQVTGIEQQVASAHLLLGEIYKEQSELTLAKDHLDQALESAEADKSKMMQGRINLQQGMIAYQFAGDNEAAAENLTRSLALFKQIGYQRGIAQAHNNLGLMYYNKGDHFQARQELKTALTSYSNLGDVNRVMRVRMNQGLVEMTASNFLLAKDIFQEVVDWKLYTGYSFHEAHYFLSLGTAFAKLGRFESADSWLQKALENSQQTSNKFLISVVTFQIGVMEMYRSNFQSAYDYLKWALSISEEINDPVGIGYAFDRLGQLNLHHQQYIKAQSYFDKAIEVRETLDHKVVLLESQLGQLQVALDTGDAQVDQLKSRILPQIGPVERFEGAEDPFQLFCTLIDAQSAEDTVQAAETRSFALRLLQEELESIPASDRRLYLQAMPSRQAIFDLMSETETAD